MPPETSRDISYQLFEHVGGYRQPFPPSPVASSPDKYPGLAGRQATLQRRSEPRCQARLLCLHDAPDLPAQPVISLGSDRL